jgi:hypothetical protein
MSSIQNKSSAKQFLFVTTILAGLVMMSGLSSCKKYLDQKPDKKLVIPETLADCEALLDYNLVMNTNYPSSEYYADNFYLTYSSWNSQTLAKRDAYIWKADANTQLDEYFWLNAYQKVLYANQVLQSLEKINASTTDDQRNWKELKGRALFFRAFSFFSIAQLWAPPYKASSASSDLGIPIHLTPSVTENSVRASVQQTYDQILRDLNEAVDLLPDTPPSTTITKMRPCRAAALAELARVYLAMGNYANAAAKADACLQDYNTLIDYNSLNASAAFPVPRFNAEVIFQATGTHTVLVSSIAKVDSTLYRSYAANDRRKAVFFLANTGANAGTYAFKGSYDGANSINQFLGLATDEVLLIRAECYARSGNANAAMNDLNTLLRKRWNTGTYTDMTATDAADALVKVLAERRKELLFRGLRWTDLRRLNKESQFAITITRSLNGQTYTLPPNDLRYTLLIPAEVLRREPMPQNPR